MPRVADHDQRRALIAGAFQRHVAHHGLAATTFARVAAEAGISVGLIQHYFGSREELLRFVYADGLQRRDERVADLVAQGETSRLTIREILGRVLLELLPLDEDRREAHALTAALHAQALHDPDARALAERADRDLHARLSVAVTNGTTCGEVAPDVVPDLAADRILATTYGLATRLSLSDEPSAERAPDVIDTVLAAVFTGRCRRHG